MFNAFHDLFSNWSNTTDNKATTHEITVITSVFWGGETVRIIFDYEYWNNFTSKSNLKR
jgi:hypothetical protein